MAVKLLGRFTVLINGQRKRTKKGASLSPGGKIKKAESDVNGFVGHRVDEVKPSTCKFTIMLDSDVNVIDLQNLEDTTLVYEGDDGQSYLIRHASTEGDVEVKDGEVDVTMTGAAAELL